LAVREQQPVQFLKREKERSERSEKERRKINKSGLVSPICKLYKYSILTSPATAPEKLDGVYVA
jgi:hypothetical protein